MLRQIESLCELAPRVEHPLCREPDRQLVPVPARDGGVRLEWRLDLIRRLDLELDHHVGARQGSVDVSASPLYRIGGEAQLADRLLRVEGVGQHLELDRQCVERRAGLLRRIGGDDRDRLPGIGWFGGQNRLRGAECGCVRNRGLGAHYRTHAVGAARRLEVERLDARAGDR